VKKKYLTLNNKQRNDLFVLEIEQKMKSIVQKRLMVELEQKLKKHNIDQSTYDRIRIEQERVRQHQLEQERVRQHQLEYERFRQQQLAFQKAEAAASRAERKAAAKAQPTPQQQAMAALRDQLNSGKISGKEVAITESPTVQREKGMINREQAIASLQKQYAGLIDPKVIETEVYDILIDPAELARRQGR